MPRATTNKLYRTFVKGLITEAGPLTYPEDATIDESNCVLNIGGYRSRRLGLDTEDGGIGYTSSSLDPNNTAVAEYTWKAVNNDPNLNFTVVQVGPNITFTDNSARPMSTTAYPFAINLNAYDVTGTGVADMPCQFASGKGYLLIVGSKIDPLLVSYDSVANSITVSQVYIQIRDFKGVDDSLANDEEPTTLTNLHQYNLQNQGWIDPDNTGTSGVSVLAFSPFGHQLTTQHASTGVITSYFSSTGRYPGNNKQWWIAKNSTTGAFDPGLLTKFFMGATRAPRGHYVVNAFNIDRSAVSGIEDLTAVTTTNRPPSVAFANGRAWFGLGSTIYFSQGLDVKEKVGNCYQEADPTSEDISDLIATDGGTIEIPEMSSVNRLIPLGGGILCFATNGVWYIAGAAGGFTPNDFSVAKVSPTGTQSPLSVVHVQDANTDMILYWSRVGIIGLQQRLGQFGKIEGQFDTSILTQTTIQTLYNAINSNYHPYVKANYDTSTNTIQWLYNSGNCPYTREFDSVLNFDLTLKAFYPWRLSKLTNSSGPYLVGIFETVTNTGLRNAFTKYLQSFHPDGGVSYYSMSEEHNASFLDWGVAYNSYLETGYELLEDAMRQKQAMFVYTYLKRTETAYIPHGDDYTVDKPSSLTLTTKWDWANSTVANRYSTPVECYRHTRIPMHDPSVSNVFDTGFPIVVTRHKVRGHGKAIQFRFENNAIGKDFVLYGWSVPYSGNTNP